jgi:hypothetical protein
VPPPRLKYSTIQPGWVSASARIEGLRLSAWNKPPRILAKPLRMLRSRFELTGVSTVNTNAPSPASAVRLIKSVLTAGSRAA